MSLLAQQELLESAPPRRVIVPRGHCAWYGVDPSTLRTAVAAVWRDSNGNLARRVQTCSYGPLEGAARLATIYDETREFVAMLLDPDLDPDYPARGPWPAPGVVFVEQPSGRQENPNLSYAVGVVQAAIFRAVFDATGHAALVTTVASSRWKKLAVGRGNIYKPKRKGEEYGVLTWAQQNGYTGSSWDEADAMGVAECARRSIALDER